MEEDIQLEFSFEGAGNKLHIKFKGDKSKVSRDEYSREILGKNNIPKYREGVAADDGSPELVVEKCGIINSIEDYYEEGNKKQALVKVKRKHLKKIKKHFPALGRDKVVPTDDRSGFSLFIPCSFTPGEYKKALGCKPAPRSSARKR